MSARDEQPPKKKTTIRKKKTSAIKVVKRADTPPSAETAINQQIEDAIMQAFTRFHNTAATTKQSKLKDLYHLDTVVTEYLQSFMILGYDINGEKVCITHAENASARDALIEHLRSTFFGIMNGSGDNS
jgi:hypothetical protein